MQSESTEYNSDTGCELKEEDSGKYEDFFSNYSDVETDAKSDSSHVMEISSGVHRTSSGPFEVESNHGNQGTSGPSRIDGVMVVVAISTIASRSTIRATARMDATAGIYDEPTTRHEASSHPTF
jgi:hypothetical protein